MILVVAECSQLMGKLGRQLTCRKIANKWPIAITANHLIAER
jgi:hypothetical protein